VSGPLLDRIDLAIDVPAVDAEALALASPRCASHGAAQAPAGPRAQDTRVQDDGARPTGVRESEMPRTAEHGTGAHEHAVRARVEMARRTQLARQGKTNARLTPAEVAAHCVPDAAGQALLAQAMARLSLSARAYHRVLKVARTIADLAGTTTIVAPHVAEAVGYRRFDRT